MSELEQLLAGATEPVLVAMANLGLLKRARKDLEREPPTTGLVRDGAALVLHREGFEIRLVAPLTRSTCNCPAVGICRHILAAILLARETLEPGQARPFDPAELAALTLAELETWAGKPLLRQAEKTLAQGEAEITLSVESSQGILRVPSHHLECRWQGGAGLESLLCTCHAVEPCVHRVMCLLGWLRAQGVVAPAPVGLELQARSGVVRGRAEVLASLGQVLGEMAELGTSRLSEASAERLQSLGMSTHGVDLPRLSRVLRSLEGEVRALLERQARATTRGWLTTAAQAEALRTALLGPAPPPGLVGTHKAQFLEMPGSVELWGLGAHRFSTRSGYSGLTLFFGDEAGRWSQWSQVLPSGRGGFDPLARYHQEGPWQGCPDPDRASRSHVRLAGAFKSPAGNLSGRPSTRALVVGPTQLAQLRVPAVTCWEVLRQRARELFAGGLTERHSSQRLALLTPSGWDSAQFDPISQQLEWAAWDDQGQRLRLRLPYAAETQAAIPWIERTPLEGAWVLGFVRLDEELWLEPVTILREVGLTHLTLDLEKSRPTGATAGANVPEDEELDEEPWEELSGSSRLLVALDTVGAELEALAEAGTRSARDLGGLGQHVDRLEHLGLAVCARSLRQFLQTRGQPGAGLALLRSAYLVAQQRRLLAVEESLATI